MEIEKQINENIQSKLMIDALQKELESLNIKYDSLNKENNKTSKTLNSEYEKKLASLREELEKKNDYLNSKERNINSTLSKKVKENEELLKQIEDFKIKEKADKNEINKLNSKILDFEKQMTSAKNNINELQIKMKVNKNERDSLSSLIEKLNSDNKIFEEKNASLLKEKTNMQQIIETLNKTINNLNSELGKAKAENDNILKEKKDLIKNLEKERLEINSLNAQIIDLNREIKELRSKFSIEKDEKNKNLNNIILDLEEDVAKLNASIIKKETEITVLTKKNEELRNEIRDLSKVSESLKNESSSFKKIEESLRLENKNILKSEENIKIELMNLIKSEESLKSEIKILTKKDENKNSEINKLKKDLETLEQKNNQLQKSVNEKVEKTEVLKLEIDNLKLIKEELNAKIKSLLDNEGILKLEIEQHIKNEHNYKTEIKNHIERENNHKSENKTLLTSEENLKMELKNLMNENTSYQDIFRNNTKNEEEKILTLKKKINDLEKDKNNLIANYENLNTEHEKLKKLNLETKKDNENLNAKIKEQEKNIATIKYERGNFMAEVENLKVLTEDYDQKCERITELEEKISKLKREKANKNNEEINLLNKIISEKTSKIQQLEKEVNKLEKEITDINTSNSINKKMKDLNISSIANMEKEDISLSEKYEILNKEFFIVEENRNKLKILNDKKLNYLLKFSDKFIEMNNCIINAIEAINSKLSPNDFAYQIPILDIINEINFSDLKDIFTKIRSNDINESFNACNTFFNDFFEEKIMKIPDTINQNVNNISSKFFKTYEDYQIKTTSVTKFEKDIKTLTDKNKSNDIEKINLSTLLEGRDQECDQLMFKLDDVEKKYRNYRESQKASNEKYEQKIDNYEKENKKLLDAISKIQAELELVLDENEKLKNEKDKLHNLETNCFGNFVIANTNNRENNLLNPSSVSNRNNSINNSKYNSNNNLLLFVEEEGKKSKFSRSNTLNSQSEHAFSFTNNNNNNNADSKPKTQKIEEKYNDLFEENKKMKLIFDECTQTIYDAIKNYSPNLFEEPSDSFNNNNINSNKQGNNFHNNHNMSTINNIPDSKGSKNSNVSLNSNYSFSCDRDSISKAVELFKKYNKEINEKNKRLEKEVSEYESNLRMYKIMAEEYKNALDFALKKNNKMQFENLQGNLNENLNTSHKDNLNNGDQSERLKTENIANFTVEDLIEAGHLNLENSFRNNNDLKAIENLEKKLGPNNLENMLSINSNRNQVHNNNIILPNTDNQFLKTEDIKLNLNLNSNKDKNENNGQSNNSDKFNYLSYLEKFNNPADYKIILFKKLSDDLIWYLLGSKSGEQKKEAESKKNEASSNNNSINSNTNTITNVNTTNNASNISKNKEDTELNYFGKSNNNIIDVDLSMLKKIKSKTSNRDNRYSLLVNKDSINNKSEKKNNINSNNPNNNSITINYGKDYDYYMWVPGKIIANNLLNFEFEKNHSGETIENSSNRNTHNINSKEKHSDRACPNCEKNKNDLANNLHINELEKKYTAMLDEKDTEIKELLAIQEDMLKSITEKTKEIENYKETCNQLTKANTENDQCNKPVDSKIVSIEKYETLLSEFKEEQDKGYELMKVYEQLKTDYDNMAKKMYNMSNKHDIGNLNKDELEAKAMNKSFNNKSINEIKDLNDIEIDDILQMHNRHSLGGINELKELTQKFKNSNYNTAPIANSKGNKSNFNLNTEQNADFNDFILNKNEGYYTVIILISIFSLIFFYVLKKNLF